MAARRFPFPIPFGWFAVGRLDELPLDPVSTHQLFGRSLVLWQSDGERHLVDSVCPHLGAHLGVGGRVEDGCLVCPFHEWSYGADGTNVAIPYSERPNRKARFESPWVAWRLLTLETRMEQCQQNEHRGSRRRVGTAPRRRNVRCAWSASSAPSWAPITAR
jgi:nitrite reductase/ring-hydroxylating ferredoxin subunit